MARYATHDENSLLSYLGQQLERAGEPVSDAHAEQSQKLTNEAAELRHPMGVLDATVPENPDIIISKLCSAIDLDPRNTLAMVMLARMTRVPHRNKAAIVWKIATRTSAAQSSLQIRNNPHWSIGSRDERTLMATLVNCALALDAADWYDAANKLRTAALRLDKRDGYGLRYNITSHALMTGNVRTVAKWLRWARVNQQIPSFWCWANVLYQRLIGNIDDTAPLTFALETQPLLPFFLVNEPSPLDDFSHVYIQSGSPQEQQYHAAMLHRSWAAHPDDFVWLCELTDSIDP